jgi:hypothetical protein
MTVDKVTPSTPVPSQTLNPLTVELTLTNTSDQPLSGVRIVGERGEPISSQPALDASLADPTPAPSTPTVDIKPTSPVRVDLPADGSVNVTFATTTGIPTDAGLCLCAKAAVYPLYFSAHVDGAGGVDQRLGLAGTYLPSFYAKPAALHVNWVWPLIDRPHRLFGSTTFTDDDLAAEVAPDGRLDRALQVVEQVGSRFPLTLVIDPELLDELEVMATDKYVVQSAGATVPGTGQPVAAAWLARLRQALSSDPGVQVELTPYADPDVESLTQHGLRWSASMPADMAAHVADALPGRSLDTTVAWPAAGAISARTLQTLAGSGVSTVVLDAAAVTPHSPKGGVPAGLARLDAQGEDVAAALTTPAVESYAAKAVSQRPVATALPQLVAELAVRAAQEPDAEHALVITAPRYVDASVDAAAQAISDTSKSTFSEPISLRDAVSGNLMPTGRSRLAAVPASAATLPEETIQAGTQLADSLPAVSSLLNQSRDPAAKTLVDSLPVAGQRTESSAWRDKTLTAIGDDFAKSLRAKVDAVTSGVHIVRPSSGAYTLASSSSPIPITVQNELPYPVTIQISVTTVVNGLPGFTTRDIGRQSVDANQKRTLNIPTRTERSGRIQVRAVLLTPNNARLGQPVSLTVRSTALGAIGVIITIAAGVVLALALLVRFARRFGRRRPTPPGGAPDDLPERVAQPEPTP